MNGQFAKRYERHGKYRRRLAVDEEECHEDRDKSSYMQYQGQ